MSLNSDITRMKQQLVNKYKKKGLYENFGQREVHKLRDKYNYNCMIYGTPEQKDQAKLITDFDDWCMNYNGE